MELTLSETKVPIPEELSETLTVNNIGLCLLAPWFTRLFTIFGYIDEERKKIRNTASKVRMIFLR